MSFGNPVDSLTVPNGAQPDDSQFYLGQEVPPELSAKYGADNVVGVLLYRYDANRYSFTAIVRNYAFRSLSRIEGAVDLRRVPLDRVTEVLIYEIEADYTALVLPSTAMYTGSAIFSGNTYVDGKLWCTDVAVDGVTMGAGLVNRTAVMGNPVTTVTTTETAVRALPSYTYRGGRAFELKLTCQVTATAVADVVPRVRKGDVATGSVLIDNGRYQVGVAGNDRYFEFTGRFRTVNESVTTILTVSAFVSTGSLAFKGFSGSPLEIAVRDIGSYDDYPALPTL